MPYIERIEIAAHYRAPDMVIDLSREGDRPRHLILTGPNGSGKTTILRRLVEEVEYAAGSIGGDAAADSLNRRTSGSGFRVTVGWQGDASPAGRRGTGRWLGAWLPDDRLGEMRAVEQFRRLEHRRAPLHERVAIDFHQFLVNLHVQRAIKREKNPAEAESIGRTLDGLRGDLATLFERPALAFELDDERWQVDLIESGYPPVGFDVLAAGHRSVLQMLAEVVLRLDALELDREDPKLSGVVVIDEVELHLHPSLQEAVLPFLTARFPRLQFIVATHSPAVLSSIGDALVVDLRDGRQMVSEALRGIRYGDLMTGHFGIETDYDLDSTHKMQRLHALWHKGARSDDEERELRALAHELSQRSHALALDIEMRLGGDG